MTPRVCAGKPDEVVDVDEDKTGKVLGEDVGEDKLEIGVIVRGEEDNVANNNDEEKFEQLTSVISVVS